MFKKAQDLVVKEFKSMSQSNEVFMLNVDPEAMWDRYISGFEEEYMQEHNCNACKSFIRKYGGVCIIEGNSIVSLWEGLNGSDSGPFEKSFNMLSDYCKDRDIISVFYSRDPLCGTPKTLSEKGERWEHFYINNKSSRSGRNWHADKMKSTESKNMMGDFFDSINIEAIDRSIELMKSRKLSRSEQFLPKLENLKVVFEKFTGSNNKDVFLWANAGDLSVSRMKTGSLGALLKSLSESGGSDEAACIRSFNSMTSAENYQRSTRTASVSQLDKFKASLEKKGLLKKVTSRRHAHDSEIDVNDLLYSFTPDQFVESADPFEMTKKELDLDINKITNSAQEITMDELIKEVVPEASEIKVLIENRLRNNFASLIAPPEGDDTESMGLMSYPNDYSLSYSGGFADSIKDKVKSAGGSVDGYACFRLHWYNHDDLDAHMNMACGDHVYHGKQYSKKYNCHLDVDMNVSNLVRGAVENIVFINKESMVVGDYIYSVKNYTKREDHDQGFVVEVEIDGEISTYSRQVNPANKRQESMVAFHFDGDKIILPKSESSRGAEGINKWGLKGNNFARLNKMFLSPNYWNGNKSGNKHYVLDLEGCKSDEPMYPFFVEQLNPAFREDRKAIEMVSKNIKVQPEDSQVSGLGFSSSTKNHFVAEVNQSGKKKIYKVNI